MKPFKVVLAGASGVGKTSIVQKMKYSDIKETSPTIGANSESIEVCYKNPDNGNDKIYTIRLWDTAGQETYKSVTKAYFNDADAILIVFSLFDIDSFNALRGWMDLIEESAPQKVCFVLLGNKNDCEHNVKEKDIEKFMKDFNIENYLETSAVTGENISQAAYLCVDTILKKNNDIYADPTPSTPTPAQQPSAGSCC